MERQTGGRTQGGAELLIVNLSQELESRMLLSYSESRYLVTVEGVLVEVEYAIVTLEIQGLEVIEQIMEVKKLKTAQRGCGIVEQALVMDLVKLCFGF